MITDANAIKFSNEHLRTGADVIYRAYSALRGINEQWNALTGTTDERYFLLAADISQASEIVTRAFFRLRRTTMLWNALSMASLFPNDAAEEVWDAPGGGSQDPNRPPITGQDVRRVKNRFEEFISFLERGTDVDSHFLSESAPQTLPITNDFIGQMLVLSSDGARTPAGNDGRKFAKLRGDQLVTEYTVTNPEFVNHILRVAVNPGGA